MPSSVLWAVDLFGRVYTLSTAGQYWELCRDTQLEFKRVSAAMQCCWGIACDNQVYVYMCASDVPIRRQEEAYENQVGAMWGLLSWLVGWKIEPLHPTLPANSHILLKIRVVQCLRGQSPCCVLTQAGWPDLHKGGFQKPRQLCPPLPFPRGPVFRGRLFALWGHEDVLADP